jgi:hypothetical protein
MKVELTQIRGYKSYIYDELALKPLKLALNHITQESKVEFYEIKFHSLTSLGAFLINGIFGRS